MADLPKKTEAMLRAVLISSPRGVPLRRVDREYKTIVGRSIPVVELGFHTLEAYIRSIRHVACLVRDSDGELLVKGVASESDQHVAKLIAKQKKPKIKAKAKFRRPISLNVRRPWPQNDRSSSIGPRPGPRVGKGLYNLPPRMMKQAVSQAAAQNISRTLIERGVAQQVHRSAQASLSVSGFRRVEPVSQAGRAPRTTTTARTVTVVPRQENPTSPKSWKKKSRWGGNEANWQEMEVNIRSDENNPSDYNRTVKIPSSSSPNIQTASKSVPLSSEDSEMYSRIKQLLESKPKGLWLTRVGVEYKKSYGTELPGDVIERLRNVPHLARCEEFPGGCILYPAKPPVHEERPPLHNGASQPGSGPKSSPSSVELYTLRPQEPPKTSTLEVSVSHIENAAHFFVHYKQNWEKIDHLQIQLSEFFQAQLGGKETLPSLKEGMFCCARFTVDDDWYRAKITECHTQGDTPTAQVIYVDFGNFESLPVSRLRMLRREHAEFPMFAVLCALEGVEPSIGDKWSSAAIDRFKELCSSSEELKMTVVGVEGHHLIVRLTDNSGTDIKAALVKEGHAAEESDTSSSTSTSTNSSSTVTSSSVSTLSSKSTSSSTTSSSSTSDKQVKEAEEKKSNARPFLGRRFLSRDDNTFQKTTEKVQMPEEDYVDVFVCNVQSTDDVCVNLYGEEYSDKLAAIEQGMLCHFEEPSSQGTPSQVNAGSIFAVYSKEIHSEGLWYRVKVLKVKGDKVHVEYMDYGDTGTVLFSSLKNIPPRFLELPFQACSLSLNGLPKTKNPEVVLKLKHMVLGKQLVAEIVKRVGDKVSVELYDMSSDVDLNINAVLRSLVIPDEELAPVLPKAGEQTDVIVTFVEGQKIFVQIQGGGITRLEELMNDISEHYSQPIKAAEFVSNPHTEKICCAKCSDGSWYRAVVTKLLPDRQVEVQYVDYGDTEALPIASLREPARAISHVNSLPFQVLECQLEGANKESWNQDLAYRLAETVMGQKAVLEVVHTLDVPVVRLFVPSEDENQGLISVAELIGIETPPPPQQQHEPTAAGVEDTVAESVEDGSIDGDSVTSESSSDASKSQDESEKKASDFPPPLDLNKPFVDISVLEAEDPSVFVFQCLEYLSELEANQEKLQGHFLNKKRSPFKDIRPGVLCAALQASDDTWYRAVVKAVLSPQQVCVRFADYGDFGIVPSSSLQPLSEEFRELPFMAVRGSLQGVEPVGDDCAEWSEEAKRRFGELTIEKTLVAKPKGAANCGGLPSSEETKIKLELYDTSDQKQDLMIADVLVNEGLAQIISST